MNRGNGTQGFDRSSAAAGNRDSAFAGAGNSAQTRQSIDRGNASAGAARQQPAARSQPSTRSAPAARPSGGGAPRGGGGGRGGGGRR